MIDGRPRQLLANGLVMSSAFAGLEGCVIASINLSAALFSPCLASDVNAMLFACFSIGTLAAPFVVRHTGLKRSMVISMALYSLYLLPFIWAERTSLLAAAAVGGLAGSVLWTAQGVYFTRNALAYAAAKSAVTDTTGESRAISVFAGIFAVVFQVVITLAKPFAATMLTLWPDDRAALFGTFSVVAVLCTISMTTIRPFPIGTASGAVAVLQHSGSIPVVRAVPSTIISGSSRTSSSVVTITSSTSEIAISDITSSTSSTAAAIAAASTGAPTATKPFTPPELSEARQSTTRRPCPALVRVFIDRRMLLVMLYNFAYGLSTAFFPSHVTLLTKLSYEDGCGVTSLGLGANGTVGGVNATAAGTTPGVCGEPAPAGASLLASANASSLDVSGSDCTGGAAMVGWMYAIAGLSSALIAASFALASHRFLAGRSVALMLGSVGFSAPCVLLLLAVASDPEHANAPRLPMATLLAVFVCYGVGTAAWQGSCMALVGDLFKSDEAEHRAAFATLKLTSGVASSFGFVLFGRFGLRASAFLTLAANVLGLTAVVALVALEALYMASARRAPAAPMVSNHLESSVAGNKGESTTSSTKDDHRHGVQLELQLSSRSAKPTEPDPHPQLREDLRSEFDP